MSTDVDDDTMIVVVDHGVGLRADSSTRAPGAGPKIITERTDAFAI